MMNGAGSVRHEPLPAALVQPGVQVMFNDRRWSATAPDTIDRGPIDAALSKLNGEELVNRAILLLDRRSVIAAGNYSVSDDGHAVPLYAIERRDGSVERWGINTRTVDVRPASARDPSRAVVAVWRGDVRVPYSGDTGIGSAVIHFDRIRFDDSPDEPYLRSHTRSSTAAALSSLICRAEAVLNDLRALKATL